MNRMHSIFATPISGSADPFRIHHSGHRIRPVSEILANLWTFISTATLMFNPSDDRVGSGRTADGNDRPASIAYNDAHPLPLNDERGPLPLTVFALWLKYWCYTRGECWGLFAALRRFAQQFPEMDVTFVGNTLGWASGMEPPTPREEAKKMCEYLLAFHRLPGNLAMAETPFFRLPDLDRRRVNESTDNESNYKNPQQFVIEQGAMFLIDREGLVASQRRLSMKGNGDQQIEGLIRTLLARPRKG